MRRVCLTIFALLISRGLSAAVLTILHTSDLHGRVHPKDALANRDLGEGLARVATAVERIRAEGNPTLLLDSGDTIQGAPSQALVFAGKAGDGSDPIIRSMNRIAYDAMAVGNHEFDFGVARLEKSRREARFPWLSANTLRDDGLPAFDPYVVRELAGIRVGILGLTTPHVANWVSASFLSGLRFADSVGEARKYVPILRGKERCDLVIVLTHQGFERDPGTGVDRGMGGENQAYALATEVPGIDLLLTGHAHTVISPRRLGETWISQPGRWGNTLTRFDLAIQKSGGGPAVFRVTGRNLSMRSVPPDTRIAAAVQEEHDATMQTLAETAAELIVPVSAHGTRERDTGLLDWLHGVQLREGRADLSFCSLLPAQMPDWAAGPLTVRQIWAFYPYENTLVTVRAKGRQVRAALERSTDCLAGRETRGRNCDTLEGADYLIDPTRPDGRRVVSLSRNGRPIRDDDTFSVALNSYRAAGGGGFPMWKGATRLSETAGLRDLLLANARARKRLRLEASGNWKVVGRP